MAKSKSIPWSSSFLYNLNHDLDLTVYIKSGSIIPVQVESIKRQKTENSDGKKWKISAIYEGKENLNPQINPAQKKRKLIKRNIT